MLSRNVRKLTTNQRCVTSQKSEDSFTLQWKREIEHCPYILVVSQLVISIYILQSHTYPDFILACVEQGVCSVV